eukprot:7388897-Prymnesium_polylepis.1
MLETVQRELVGAGLLHWPRVYLGGGFDAVETKRFGALVAAKRGTLVDAIERATHVVVGDTPLAGCCVRAVHLEAGEETARALEHTPFTPDSADRWVELPAGAPRPEIGDGAHERPWRVQGRWLRDLAHWNEWMNE